MNDVGICWLSSILAFIAGFVAGLIFYYEVTKK